MWLPLIPLAIGATILGLLSSYFLDPNYLEFWKDSIFVLDNHTAWANYEDVPSYIKYLPTVLSLLGITLAYFNLYDNSINT